MAPDLARARADPRDPAIDAWLRSLKPQAELVARFALRAKFPSVRADPAFSARINQLMAAINPDARQLYAILNDAKRLETNISAGIGGPAPAERRSD